MHTFEWDEQKASINAHKHGVTFDEAVTVFGDDMAITFPDVEHSELEDRMRTYGNTQLGRLLVVIHTERRNKTRIISARRATRQERKIYEE